MLSALANNNSSGDQFPTSSTTGASASSTTANTSTNSLTSNDFIKLMLTELQNQDPTNPTSNSELLQQESEIATLQSNTDLQKSLSSSALQTSVGSASALIGKTVTGINASNDSSTGVVNSVSVAGGNVSLTLDSGETLPLSGLASIQSAAAKNASGN